MNSGRQAVVQEARNATPGKSGASGWRVDPASRPSDSEPRGGAPVPFVKGVGVSRSPLRACPTPWAVCRRGGRRGGNTSGAAGAFREGARNWWISIRASDT